VHVKEICASVLCAVGTCNPLTGCNNTQIPDCQTCGSNTCNTTGCFPQVCNHTTLTCVSAPVNCDDGNVCTNNTCVEIGGVATCQSTPIPCVNTNPCQTVTCDPVAGCLFSNITCPSISPCLTPACVVTGPTTSNCTYTPIPCDESNLCAPQVCSGGVCVLSPNAPNCNDGNNCTIDSCNITTGVCYTEPLCTDPGTACNPITCQLGICVQGQYNCSTGNLCFPGSCVENGTTASCVVNPVPCPSDVCNPETCDPASGLCVGVNNSINCDDHNPCTEDTTGCDADYGFFCNHTEVNSSICDDWDMCTNDYCNTTDSYAPNATSACYHTQITCTAPNICSAVNGCNPINGCVIVPFVCPAPADYCNVSTCDTIAGCVTVPRPCPVNDNFCYMGVCDPVGQQCQQLQRPNFGTITNAQGVTCLLAYSTAAKASLAAGTVAGVVIAAVVAAAIIAVAAKKGVDVFMASRAGPVGAASNNPLYAQAPGSGNNPLYS